MTCIPVWCVAFSLALIFVMDSPYKAGPTVAGLGLVGRVRSVRQEEGYLDDKSGKAEEYKRFPVDLETFGPDGDVLEDTFFNEDGSTAYKWEYEYDPKKRLREQVLYRNGEAELTKIYFYDELARTCTITHRAPDGTVSPSEIQTYDAAGRQTGQDSLARDRKLLSRTCLLRDAEGRLIEEMTFSVWRGHLQVPDRTKYDYGADGRLSRKRIYNASRQDPDFDYIYAYQSDPTGNWTTRTESQLVVDSQGQPAYHPHNIIYRTIEYFTGR
jgi:hypothetical protein